MAKHKPGDVLGFPWGTLFLWYESLLLDWFWVSKIPSYMYSIVHKFFITSYFLDDFLYYIKCCQRFILFSPRSNWHFLWGPVGGRGNGKSRPPPQILNQRRWPLTFENEHFNTDCGPFVHNASFLVRLLFSKTKPQTNRNSLNRKSEDRICNLWFRKTVGKSCSPHMAVPCC